MPRIWLIPTNRRTSRLVLTAGLLVSSLTVCGEQRPKVLGEGISPRALRLMREQMVNKRAYGPEQAAGEPDTPQPGDRPTAWASQSSDGQAEWLVCRYREAVQVQAVRVHENHSPGALVKVTAFTAAGDEVIAWEGIDPTPRTRPRGVSVIPVRLPFAVQAIKLYLDSQAVPGWNEIDAVSLEDGDGVQHWAVSVEASTTYASGSGSPAVDGKPSYSPLQATGEPDCLQPGDQGTAWASATADGQNEWLELEFEQAQRPAEIVVHENNAPGAISRVSVFDSKNSEVVIWEGVDPTPTSQPWGVSVFPVDVAFDFKRVRVTIKSRDVPGYNEIDAVGLRALNGDVQWASGAKASTTYGVAVVEPEAMPAMSPDNPDVESLQKEVQQLREDVAALKAALKMLTELRQGQDSGKP